MRSFALFLIDHFADPRIVISGKYVLILKQENEQNYLY